MVSRVSAGQGGNGGKNLHRNNLLITEKGAPGVVERKAPRRKQRWILIKTDTVAAGAITNRGQLIKVRPKVLINREYESSPRYARVPAVINRHASPRRRAKAPRARRRIVLAFQFGDRWKNRTADALNLGRKEIGWWE